MTLTRARTIQYLGILVLLMLIAVSYWYFSVRAGVKSNTSASQPQGTGQLDSGLVGYWKLDETTGSTAADASTNGNNGTLVNMENGDWTTGQIGNGLDFDGSNEEITVPGANPIDIRSSLTLSTWAKFDTLPGNGQSRAIFRKTAAGGANHLYTLRFTNLGAPTYHLLFTPGGGGAFNYSDAFAATTGTWYLLTLTYDAGTDVITYYFNGVPVGTDTDTVVGGYAGGTGDLYIGSTGGSEYFDGQLDEMRIYDRVLSSDEVAELQRLTMPTSVDTSLKAYWSFDGQSLSGTTASDRSGTGNHGTLNNGPTARKGVVGQALNFDGSNDSVTSSSDSPALASLTQASVAFWINPRGASFQGGIFSTLAGDGGGNGSFSNGFMVSGDTWAGTQTIRFVADGSTGDMQTRSTSVLSLNDWTHVVVVWSGSLTAADTKFYINGVLDKTVGMINGSGSFVPSDGNFTIGRMDGSYTLDGQLDELRVYNRVLTDAEAKGLYDIAKPDAANSSSSQAQGTGRLDSGLSAYFRFDDGTSGATPTTAADSSVNGLTAGTLTNGPTWTAGQIGSAVAFDGTNDSVYVASATAFDIALGEKITTAFWYTANQADGTAAGVYDAASATGGCAHNQVALSGGASTDILSFYYRTDTCDGIDAVQITGVSKNIWHHVVSTYDSSTGAFAAYLDGTLRATATNAIDIAMNLTDLNIGGGGNQYLLGSVDEFRFYRRALSSDEVGALYRLTSPTSIDTSLKGYWSFNGQDMNATTAFDQSGAGNNGTLTGGPTTSKGIVGQGLLLDGVNDVVQLLNDAPNITGALTASFWLKTTAVSQKTILGFWQTTGWTVQLDGDGSAPGKLSFYSNNSGFKHANTAVNDGTWHHVAFTLTSGGVLTMYRDGVVDGSYTSVPLPGSYTDDKFFSSIPGGGGYFPGTLDEIRIYNRALTVAEIQGQYDSARPDKTNSSVSTPQGTGRLDSGLAGYWKFDETTGSTAADASTNGYTGTLQSMENGDWAAGRIGNGLTFDGTDEYISTGIYAPFQFADQTFTVSGWFNKNNATTGYVIAQGGCTGGWLVRMDTGALTAAVRGSGSCGSVPVVRSSASTGLNDGSWHHFAAVITTSTTANSGHSISIYIDGTLNQGALTLDGSNVYLPVSSPLVIASRDGALDQPFHGTLDEMRIYNRGLSADEVSQLYRLGTPTGTDTSLKGYWSFNGQDMTATTAYDRSGSAINGTLAGGARAVRGKLGQALSFDGVDDYIALGSHTTEQTTYSILFWMYQSGTDTGTLLQRGNSGGCFYNPRFGISATSVTFAESGCDSSGVIGSVSVDIGWHHIGLTRNGGTAELYVDGVLVPTSGGPQAPLGPDNGRFSLGAGWENNTAYGSFAVSQLDEVRVYNRELSAVEIESIYKQNK